MSKTSQKGGIYIEINGNTAPLEKQLKEARNKSKAIVENIANSTKNAFSKNAMGDISANLAKSFGSIKASIRAINTDTKTVADQFSVIGKEIGLTANQANILDSSISKAMKAGEERQIVKNLKLIQQQTGMTAAEMKNLALELGITEKQFNDYSNRTKNCLSTMNKFSGVAKTVGATLLGVTASVGVFAKSTLEASMALERLSTAYATIFGSKQGAVDQLQVIREQTKAVGQQFMETAEAAKGFFAAGQGSTLAPEMNKIFKSISDAGAALQLTQDDMNGVFLAFGQMISKGKVQAEELRGQIGERLPGAFQMAAQAMGMSTAELDKFMADGKLVAEDLLPKLSDLMEQRFSEAAKKAAETLQGSLNNMYSEWEQFKVNIAASGPAKFFVQIITETLAAKNAAYADEERRNRAIAHLRNTGASKLNLPDETGYIQEFSEAQISQASAMLDVLNSVNTAGKDLADNLRKNMEEASSLYRQTTSSILKNSNEAKIQEINDQRDILESRKKAHDAAIEYEFKTGQITAQKRDELLKDSNDRFNKSNDELDAKLKKIQDSVDKAGKKGAGAATKAANAQSIYNTTLENTLSHIESLQDQLKLDKTQTVTAKKIALTEKYEEQLRKVNNQIEKQVRTGSITYSQGEELKALKAKELSLERDVKLRELENKEVEENLSHLQEQLSFYNDLASMSGNYMTSMELQNQIIDIQAQKYRDLKTIPESMIESWAEWKKLEASTDPFDGAYRGLKKFTAEYGNSAKQWESLTYNFSKNFEQTCHNMFDEFVETGKLSFDSMADLFKSLLKQMAYLALVQPIVISVVNGITGTTGAVGSAANAGASTGAGGLTNAATGIAQNAVMAKAGGGLMSAAGGWLNSTAASLFPSTFASNSTIAAVNGTSNMVNSAVGGSYAALPTQTATDVLSSGWTMGAGLVGGAIGNYLLVPALGIKQGAGTSIGGMVGGAAGTIGGGLLGATALGASVGGPIGAGIGALLGAVAGSFGGSLFGGYEDEPGYYINAWTDLTKKGGLKDYKQGTAIQNHRWDSFTDDMASKMRDQVARPLMEEFRDTTSSIKDQLVSVGGKSLGESFYAAVRKYQGSGDKKTGKNGIELSDYFHIHGEWFDTNSPDYEKWVEKLSKQYQETMVKSIANMDMSPIVKAADGKIANTEEEIAQALIKAGALIGVGSTIEDEELQQTFNEGISKSLIKALKKIDTSTLGLKIDKSSLEGWTAAAQAMQRWNEITAQIKGLEDPTSEVGKKASELATTFTSWKTELESLGWTSKKVMEIDQKRVKALTEYADEVIAEYSGGDNAFAAELEDITTAFSDLGKVLKEQNLSSKILKKVDDAQTTAIDNLVSETLSQYDVVTNELKEKIDEINKVFGNLLADESIKYLSTSNISDIKDKRKSAIQGYIDELLDDYDDVNNTASGLTSISKHFSSIIEAMQSASDIYSRKDIVNVQKKSADAMRRYVASITDTYKITNELDGSINEINNTFNDLTDAMRQVGMSVTDVIAVEKQRTQVLARLKNETMRSYDQSLNLRVSSLQYGGDSSNYQITSLLYSQQSELNEIEDRIGRRNLEYDTAVRVQQAELINTKINLLQDQLKNLLQNQLENATEMLNTATSIKNTFNSILRNLKSARTNLWTSDKNLVTQRYGEAYKQFNDVYARAMQGDENALNELPSIGQTVLSLAKEEAGSRGEYDTAFYDINKRLKTAEDYAASQLSTAEKNVDVYTAQVNGIKSQIEAVNGVGDQVSGSIESLQSQIAAYEQELSSVLNTLVATYNTSASASLAQREALLQAKVDQLNATAYQGRTDWTVKSLMQAIDDAGLNLESWYMKYGSKEGLEVNYDAVAQTLAYMTDEELSILEKKVNLMNQGLTLGRGQQAGGWSKESVVKAMLKAGMSVQQWYDKYGAKEFSSVGTLQDLNQKAILQTKADLMNMGQTLGKGQKAGNWTAESVLKKITDSGLTFDQWYTKYGSKELEEAAKNAGIISGDVTRLMTTSSEYYKILCEKAKALNDTKFETATVAAGGWTAQKVKDEIASRGMTVEEWYKKYGKAEGFILETSKNTGSLGKTFTDVIKSQTTSLVSSIKLLNDGTVSSKQAILDTKAKLMQYGEALGKGQTAGNQTAAGVLKSIEKSGMSFDDWYTKYGSKEIEAAATNTGTVVKSLSDLKTITDAYDKLLVDKATQLNATKYETAKIAAGAWTAKDVKDEIASRGMTVKEWYEKYGKSEGYLLNTSDNTKSTSVNTNGMIEALNDYNSAHDLNANGQVLALKAALMNMGQTLSEGQKAGGWTMQSVLEAIEANGMTFNEWYNKYGKHEIDEAAINAGFISKNAANVSGFTNSILDEQTLKFVTGLNDVKSAVNGLNLSPTIPVNLQPYFTIKVDQAGKVTTSKTTGNQTNTTYTISNGSSSSGSSSGSSSSSSTVAKTVTQLTSEQQKNLDLKTRAMLGGYTLAAGQSTAGWSHQKVLDEIIRIYGSFDKWWDKAGKKEINNLYLASGARTTTSTRYWSDFELLEAKAKALNRERYKGINTWIASTTLAEINSRGLSLRDWYNKYGKAEGFAAGGITPRNKAYWVGEEGPELLMSPQNYGILNNRDSIDLMRTNYLPRVVNVDGSKSEMYELINIMRQLLRVNDDGAYNIKKMKDVLQEWNVEGLPATA